MTISIIKSAPVLSTSGDNFWDEKRKKIGLKVHVYIVVCYFSLIIFSTIELTLFTTCFAQSQAALTMIQDPVRIVK